MNDQRTPPVLDDAVVDGDTLRRRGLWLPLQDVTDAGRPRLEWASELPADIRETADRILPRVRERAVEAAVDAARRRLRGTPPADDGTEQR